MTRPPRYGPAPAWELTPPPARPRPPPAKPRPTPEPFETTPLGDVSGHAQTDLVELARKKGTRP